MFGLVFLFRNLSEGCRTTVDDVFKPEVEPQSIASCIILCSVTCRSPLPHNVFGARWIAMGGSGAAQAEGWFRDAINCSVVGCRLDCAA